MSEAHATATVTAVVTRADGTTETFVSEDVTIYEKDDADGDPDDSR